MDNFSLGGLAFCLWCATVTPQHPCPNGTVVWAVDDKVAQEQISGWKPVMCKEEWIKTLQETRSTTPPRR